jgi:hypothetical protein
MPHAPMPWIGLAALVAMFVLPFLPDWLFEAPDGPPPPAPARLRP